MQDVVLERLAAAVKALTEASSASESLQRHLSRGRFYREVKLDRRLRTQDIVRTINVARQHVTRVHTGSMVVTKAVRESEDELVRPDQSAFE